MLTVVEVKEAKGAGSSWVLPLLIVHIGIFLSHYLQLLSRICQSDF